MSIIHSQLRSTRFTPNWSSVEEDGVKLDVCELPNNTTKYFFLEGKAGVCGNRRHVRTEFPSGTTQWYEGQCGKERLVKKYDARTRETHTF